MSNKKLKWGACIPLIGGMPIASSLETGVDPAFFLSYTPFASNDSHCFNYFKKTPVHLIDQEELKPIDDVDFVNSTCPCAGLSV